ncbi:hypothetical protein [Breznakiella homolactica]|uniref:Uncharacterized protein n=1 Tax=Breznakiella homolactica TaxID=2798577 RepID=A0A7T7XQ52_9SPIR|nr:hypothetical protein [Breznakiella homolactica]QQO10437.1 hypothetical protein JFL75_05835 [Breznakiella homolactica]
MILSIRIISKDDQVLTLARSPKWRLFFLILAAFFLAGIIILNEAPLLFIILIAVSLFAGLYDDKMEFNRTAGTFAAVSGIGPVCRRREYPMDGFLAVILKSAVSSSFEKKDKSPYAKDPIFPKLFRKGRSTLWLEFKNSETPRFLIDDGSHWDKDNLETLGTAVAEFCGIPFEGPEKKEDDED